MVTIVERTTPLEMDKMGCRRRSFVLNVALFFLLSSLILLNVLKGLSPWFLAWCVAIAKFLRVDSILRRVELLILGSNVLSASNR